MMLVHWDQQGVTVFTAVVTTQSGSQSYTIISDDVGSLGPARSDCLHRSCDTQSGSQSYAIISDELRHDKFAVAAYNRTILDHAAASGIDVRKVPSSQTSRSFTCGRESTYYLESHKRNEE